MTANGRNDAHKVQLPAGTPSQGAVLQITCSGYHEFSNRGLIIPSETGEATFRIDDVDLIVVDSPPVPPDPNPAPGPATDPQGIIAEVYQTGQFNLATHDGCGLFTEECCKQLHNRNNQMWGHIKKNPGQNQYNGHAVDALMLLAGEGNGIWDIIHDSVSPNATPQYIYKGEPEPDLWYYPMPEAGDYALALTRNWKKRAEEFR